MGENKWEDLEMDCLVNVLERVGMESLLLDVPFVCKSWYRASLRPSYWKSLDFPQEQSYDDFLSRYMELKSFRIAALKKLVIDRSQRNATLLNLLYCAIANVLKYAADECPALTTLDLIDLIYEFSRIIPELIGKWKNLKVLKYAFSDDLTLILLEIRLNCKNFEGLYIHGASDIGETRAMAIIDNLPNIKYLSLKGGWITRENLVMLLLGCKQLVLLHVRDCIGFEVDQEILKLASHIKDFMCDGSKIQDDYYYYH